MNKNSIRYWSLTGLVSAFMVFSAVMYLTADQMAAAFRHLGFPDYFRVELAIAKLIGAAALLVPVPPRVKEWAYAGFGITFVSAFIAHTSSGDPMSTASAPVIALLVLVGSYMTYQGRLTAAKSARA